MKLRDKRPSEIDARIPLLVRALPPEIHLVIADHLGPLPSHALRSTCRYFRTLLPPLINLKKPLTQKKADEAAEQWNAASAAYDNSNFYGRLAACQTCLRLRKRGKFADSPASVSWTCKPARPAWLFCVDCGMEPIGCDQWGMKFLGRTPYQRGCSLAIDGKAHIVCYRCGELWAEEGRKGRNGMVCKRCT